MILNSFFYWKNWKNFVLYKRKIVELNQFLSKKNSGVYEVIIWVLKITGLIAKYEALGFASFEVYLHNKKIHKIMIIYI